MSPSSSTRAAASLEHQQQHQQSPPPPLWRPKQGHRRRTDLEAPLAPLFSPTWAFEVEGAQLRRVLGHCCRAPGPGAGQGGGGGEDEDDGSLVVGCLEDGRRQQASGLVAATGRVDLLRVPEAHRRYISRVFWVGWVGSEWVG